MLYRVGQFVLTLRGSLLVLGASWAAIIFVVGPDGEFFINDDWSFFRAFENFVASGRMTSTGWGPSHAPGGPALVVHILWARLFTLIAGQSILVLRLSVLTMGTLGSLAMLILLRRGGCSSLVSLAGALALVANPLYLSQSFTFMSDVTFVALSLYSLLFLGLAVQSRSTWFFVIGLVFCLGAILVRQIGAVIVAAYLWMCIVHPRCRSMGFRKSLTISFLVVFVPWFLYEYVLYMRGGTPLLRHQVIHNMVNNFIGHSWSEYIKFLFCNLSAGLLYCGLFTSPIWILRFKQFLRKRGFVIFLCASLVAFVLVEGGIIAGWLNPPVFFWGNVVVDFGIGPILLKDTYIMKIHRLGHLEPWAYYMWVLVAALGVGIIIGRTRFAFAFPFKNSLDRDKTSFLGGLVFWSALFYLAFILATGFYDRYLIPIMAWLMVWLAAEDPDKQITGKGGTAVAAFMMLGLMGVLSVAGTHDFLEMKRAQHRAQQYVITQMNVDPCSFDGGFEFNGYYCYNVHYKPSEGKSWWWVHEEKALLTLGPLPGYKIERVFPFSRVIGPNGAVYVLTPESNP